jgi:hypothetical protein
MGLNAMFSLLSTACLTDPQTTSLNFLFMTRKHIQPHESMLPLLAYLEQKKMTEAAFAKNVLKIDQANLTNWKRRGVPHLMQVKIAKIIGMTADQYFEEIGRPTGAKSLYDSDGLTKDGLELALVWQSLHSNSMGLIRERIMREALMNHLMPWLKPIDMKKESWPDIKKDGEKQYEQHIEQVKLKLYGPPPPGVKERRKPK